mmetsp:Transcript_4442/g.12550  ORF Transcript_4442/g.12550 Transcript_4442/m.12550 type:complete len:192 (+) Transcript_4442:48-623(+)
MTSSFTISRSFVVVVVALILSLLTDSAHSWSASQLSRRDVFRAATSAVATSGMAAGVVLTGFPQLSYAEDLSSLKDELALSKSKLKEIPDLLQAQEWEKVRTVLKTPPVNKLWNLGDSQNIVLKLAKETGDVELFELKDELAYNLQMCDQLTYDNVFVYFQPGSGKIKIKEPVDSAKKAVEYLDQIIAAAN